MRRDIFVRDGTFNYDADEVSRETGLECKDASLAQQSQAKEADINEIVRRFGLTGQLPQNVRAPILADFRETVFDFQTAQNAIAMANQSFMALPADVRAEFNNDPQRFVEFCSDADNLPRLKKLGLTRPDLDVSISPKPEDSPPVTEEK